MLRDRRSPIKGCGTPWGCWSTRWSCGIWGRGVWDTPSLHPHHPPVIRAPLRAAGAARPALPSQSRGVTPPSASEPWPGGLQHPLCPRSVLSRGTEPSVSPCASPEGPCSVPPPPPGMSRRSRVCSGSAQQPRGWGGLSPGGAALCPPALGLLRMDVALTSLPAAGLGLVCPRGCSFPGRVSPVPSVTASRSGGDADAPAGCLLPACVSGCLPTPRAVGWVLQEGV